MLRMSRLLVPAIVVGMILAGLIGVNIVSAAEVPQECSTSGATLSEARSSYAADCTLPRIDCDPIRGVWYCSSRVIGAAAPGGITADEVGASEISHEVVMPPTTAEPVETTTTAVAAPPSDQSAGTPPLPASPAPTTTSAPGAPEPPALPQPSDPTTVDSTTTTSSPENSAPSSSVAPTTAPAAPAAACGVVAIEAESLPVTGAWKVVADPKASGGRYITWEGLSHERNNSRPADVISTDIRIDTAGSYRFTWAMRQPNGVESDKANDSWLNLPDAARFGPTSGGSYGGFIKVFGNSTGSFAYKGTADVNHNKSTIAIDVDRPGTYTLQIAGRSHGHQIDRIVIHHESISRSDAIAGRGNDCGQVSTPATPTTAPATTTAPTSSGDCDANTSGTADRNTDLISLHYDHAPDRDDGHATVAGREVASALGFTPWVIGGAYGADNARSYNGASERVMDATWGPDGWVDAHADWDAAVRRTADRWQRTLEACGDIWIAEGGQSDLSADVVRELQNRMPSVDTGARIHLVQHSNWNEEKALDADLAYAKANTNYIRIPDGNRGGNGTADLNDEKYGGPMLDAARRSDHSAGWAAAFEYYDPEKARLDFSDTVELLHIVGVGIDTVNDIDGFAATFMN